MLGSAAPNVGAAEATKLAAVTNLAAPKSPALQLQVTSSCEFTSLCSIVDTLSHTFARARAHGSFYSDGTVGQSKVKSFKSGWPAKWKAEYHVRFASESRHTLDPILIF